jgi:hypothetical protein
MPFDGNSMMCHPVTVTTTGLGVDLVAVATFGLPLTLKYYKTINNISLTLR